MVTQLPAPRLPPEQQKDFLPPAPKPSAQQNVIDHMDAPRSTSQRMAVEMAVESAGKQVKTQSFTSKNRASIWLNH